MASSSETSTSVADQDCYLTLRLPFAEVQIPYSGKKACEQIAEMYTGYLIVVGVVMGVIFGLAAPSFVYYRSYSALTASLTEKLAEQREPLEAAQQKVIEYFQAVKSDIHGEALTALLTEFRTDAEAASGRILAEEREKLRGQLAGPWAGKALPRDVCAEEIRSCKQYSNEKNPLQAWLDEHRNQIEILDIQTRGVNYDGGYSLVLYRRLSETPPSDALSARQ